MPLKLQDIVKFQGDRLFNGAVNIDWFQTDVEKSKKAVKSFIFHGPKYHGVTQDDVGYTHGHQLLDTTSFTRAVVRRCCGFDDQPFTLAIAGYGTGKSHLALTLAMFLSNPKGEMAESVLLALKNADSGIGDEINAMLVEESRPSLVVALNGIGNFDLTTEITRQVSHQILEYNLDTRPLDDLRPRFKQATNLIQMSSKNVIDELLSACDMSKIDDVINALKKQEEHIYSKVQEYFASRGMPIRALGGESVKDIINVICSEYCGEDKQTHATPA